MKTKFRVYDTATSIFHYKDFVVLPDGSVQMIHLSEEENDLVRDSLVLQQFTGVLDKDGKEIYEGDIVNFVSGAAFGRSFKSNITFEIGCFGYTETNIFHHLYWWPKGHGYFIEVIGNIFENPELIKK